MVAVAAAVAAGFLQRKNFSEVGFVVAMPLPRHIR